MRDVFAAIQAAYDAASVTRAAFPGGDSVPTLPAVVAERQRDAVVSAIENLAVKAAISRSVEVLWEVQAELPAWLAARPGLSAVEGKCLAHLRQALARVQALTA
jgi:hypothetical protein